MLTAADAPWPRYLAVELSGDGARLLALSPWLMRWEGEVLWLVDLTPCRRYWETLAERAGRTAAELVRELLPRLLGEDLVRAASADHPWRALLLARAMGERKVGGILDWDAPFGKALRDALTWSGWLALAKSCAVHLQSLHQKRFGAQRFAQQCRQLEGAMARLGARGPLMLAGEEAMAFRRRFGSWIGIFWEWGAPRDPASVPRTAAPLPRDPAAPFFPRASVPRSQAPRRPHLMLIPDAVGGGASEETEAPRDAGLPPREDVAAPSPSREPGFPWLAWLPRTTPERPRHLDFPLWRWDDLAPLLAEDLAALGVDPRWQPEERVTELVWQLTLNDLSEIAVSVVFRHPHDLRKDAASGFRITLLQASYAFEDAMRHARRHRESEVELPITSWSVRVAGRIVTLTTWADLFGEAGSDTDLVRLLEIENALAVGLERYTLTADWLPESSYVRAASTSTELADWVTLARRRPLFYTVTPVPLTAAELRGSRQLFLERVATKWWEAGNPDSGRRDYYQLLDREGRYLWAFRDEQGAWFKHGLFG